MDATAGTLPRDGDGDGYIEDATPRMRPDPRQADTSVHSSGRNVPDLPAGVALREPFDFPEIRRRISDDVLAAAQAIEPVSDGKHTLSLSDISYEGRAEYTSSEQERALLEGRDLATRLRGTWTLTDATGAVVGRRRATLAEVPYIADDGTFIRGGNRIPLSSQLRLLPGVYTRRRQTGDLEAHVNVAPGAGPGYRIELEPETGRFQLRFGGAAVPAYTVLRALGVSDDELRAAWGDLYGVNRAEDSPTALSRLHRKIVRMPPGAEEPDPAQRAAAVAQLLESSPLDPEVTARTLGRPIATAGKEAILAASRKLVAINRGEAEPDDRDDLAYMRFVGPEDLLSERLRKIRAPLRMALWKASKAGSLDPIPPGLFTGAIASAITDSGLGTVTEQINPLMVADQANRVTRLGEGGIGSTTGVPAESREVHTSQLGFVDFLSTPESMKAGVDLRLASGVRKGSDGRLYARFRDARTGQMVWRSPQQTADLVVAFPGELDRVPPAVTQPQADQPHVPPVGTYRLKGQPRKEWYGQNLVSAVVGGKVRTVPREQVDLELPDMESAFGPILNLVPMKSGVKGQRAVMAGRMLTQALPLVKGESPLVQAGIPGSRDDSFERRYGSLVGAIRADAGGVVVKADEDAIVVRRDDGQTKTYELARHRVGNRKTGLNQHPAVVAGQRIEPGALLARSNYTDGDGEVALGLNARVAYLADGWNFEDAITVSESFAKRASSEHYYKHDVELGGDTVADRRKFVSLFPAKYTSKQLQNLGDDGVIKVGSTVHEGDPLVLAARIRQVSYNPLHRGRGGSFDDASETWEHPTEGVVTGVTKTRDGVLVAVRTVVPMEVGDKLSGRQGDKGVISRIVPDAEMPVSKDGNPFEVLVNPLGIVTRTNPSQMVEAALGKVAAQTGKKYRVQDFSGIPDLTRFALSELQRHGLSDLEDVKDPTSGRTIPQVFAGNRFFLKLHHTSESKGQARGLGSYTAEATPARGGEEGAQAKRLSLGDLNALLSHGAYETIRDVAVRGQANPELWARYMAGFEMPEPKVSHVHRKFLETLKAAGINPVRGPGGKIRLMALADRDVDSLAEGRELRNAETVDWDTMEPVKGGLFDPELTGGHGGAGRWAAIPLAEPLPNPVMEDPIRRVLGLTEERFRAVLAGREELGKRTGPGAIRAALDAIDVPRAIDKARADIASGRAVARDAAVRRLRYLKACERLGLHPRDWVLSRVPVMPPAFRPVSTLKGSKAPLVGDVNVLYRELFDADALLRRSLGRFEDVGDERLAAYDAFKAVTGLGEPTVPRNQQRQVKGLLKQVFGSGSSKFGMLQRKLLGAPVDLVGRAVITPDPDLDMDEVGLPEDRAWEAYQPFVVRQLVRRGMGRLAAVRAARDRTQDARRALLEEMEARPVLVNRAPTLHRYNVMALRPRMVAGSVMKIPPPIIGIFAGDFDGDQMNYHVPASDEAAREALERLLPSRNLISPATFQVHMTPKNEYVAGLYAASTAETDRRERAFASVADALRARRRGELDLGDRVVVPDD